MCPSRVAEGAARGYIVPIGGAENKENDRRILRRFVEVSGGEDADIVVIPTASKMHETGPRYEALFRELGAARVRATNESAVTIPKTATTATRPTSAGRLGRASARPTSRRPRESSTGVRTVDRRSVVTGTPRGGAGTRPGHRTTA